MDDIYPRKIFSCSVLGCSAAWFQMTEGVVVYGVWHGGHTPAMRRAVKKGWTGDGSTGCLCANREIRCPEHS